MNNNSKILFLGLTLLILFISVGSISATNDTTTTTVSDDAAMNVQYDMIKEKSEIKTTTSEKIKEENPLNKNKTQKQIKTEKQPKKAVEKTQTATDYETLKQSWNNIKNEGDNTTDYIINVKNGEYKFTEELEINTTSNIKSITINGENTDKTIFNGQNITRHFNLNTTTLKVNFNNITFTNGFNNNTGGSIYSKSVVNINNSKFINNTVIPSKSSTRCYGGAIKLENNFTIAYSLFENNTMVGSNCYGGALSITTNVIGDIRNCEFINNEANRGTIYVDLSRNNITMTKCVIYDESPYSGSYIPYYSSYNWYGSNSQYNGEDLVVLVNNKTNFNMINQKNSNITLQLYKYESYYIHSLSNISLGLNKSFKITSSNNLINTTGITLSPENNYTAVIDISKLPANHDDILLYVEDLEVAKVVYNYTNIELKDITAKPGETITIKAKLTTNNNELVQAGKVAFKINGCTIGHANVKVGYASLNYKIPENYSAKDYKITVVYGGSSDFIEARMNKTLHLNKIKTSTNLTTSIEGNTLKITVDPKDEKGNTVKTGKICVKIEGKTLQTIKIKGKTTLNFTIPKSWNNREIKVLAIYGENNNHKESRTEIKTKITLPNTKTTKTDETINNYYVSANTGSDTNTGSQSSPFKTIQKAITTVTNNKQNANIYLDGIFKGVGNTNLTVPGDLHINFIGVGNSSIDGEVNYTLSNSSGVWGASLEWEPYNNGRGNWAMKITQGNGLITISNFTIKNCWNAGGSSISAYPTATVDNYGNLAVNNVSFIFNHGGVGASIRNNPGANINVTNSLFEENRKSSSTGNYGAGLYNNGTATVINSTFQNNYARWGSVTNDKNLTLINSTIRDNIGYNGGSTFKTGSGITINTGGTDFFNQGDIDGIVTVIDGCYFTNNDQLDIYVDEGIANITNCVFNKSTGISGAANSNKSVTNIINNTIINPQPSSIQASLSSSDMVKYSLHLTGGSSYLIENNTGVNLTCNAIEARSMYPIQNAIIRNNIFDNSILINSGSNNIIENNNITSKQEYAIYLGTQSNTKVIGNYLKSSQFEGDGAVSYQGTNTVVNNTPKMALIRLNDENFYQYFDDDGNLKPDYDYIDQITLIGALKDKTMIFNQTIKIGQQNGWPIIISNNTTIIINKGFVNATGIKVLNTNNQPVFILNTDNNIITGSNLTTKATNTIIINNTKNNTITGNILIADLLVGDESVKTTTADADNITGNTPLYKNYLIDDTTYNTYFNNDGTINVPEDKPIRLLIGNLNNKTLILNNNKDITIMNYHEIVAHNITIKTEGNTTLNLTNITITNTNQKPVLEIRGIKTTITYTNLTSNDNVILLENTQDIEIEHNNFITNVTNDVKAISIKNVANIDSYDNNITITANITQDNKKHTIVAINGINLTNIELSYFNITIINLNEVNDNIYAFNLINPEVNVDKKMSSRLAYNNIQIRGFNNACAINMINQSSFIKSNEIQVSAKNTIAMNMTTSNSRTSYYEQIDSNIINMISPMNNTGIRLNSCENISIRGTNFTNTMSENSIGILVYNSTNITLYNMTMDLNGKNLVAINLNQTNKINITTNNITTNIKNTTLQSIVLNNAEETLIKDNIIVTSTEYTVKLDEKSSKSIIKNNKLYALKLGDDSILSNSNIGIIDNTPIKSYKDLLLNDYTYDAFFDENGVLRDEISTAANITVVGNLYNRVLNITRPLNIKSYDNLEFINTTIIINAKNTNITNLAMGGYNTKLIINTDNCNINMQKIKLENIENKNITVITVNGNYNNISITDIDTTNNIEKAANANITQLRITGKQNSITIGSMKASNFTNSTAIKLDNADKNYLDISGRVIRVYIRSLIADNGIVLNNSNNNIIITSTKYAGMVKNVGFHLFNSSNNSIYYGEFTNSGNSKILLLENNSNYNKILGIISTSFNFDSAPVSIINSSYNILEGNTIKFSGNAYPIEILNGFENVVKHNSLISTNYKANNGVYQETTDDKAEQNNEVSENYASIPSYKALGISIRGTLKVHQTITIHVFDGNFVSKGGNYTFFVNGKEIGTVNTRSNTADMNYTILGDEGDRLIVTVMQKNTAVLTNISVFAPIIKLDTQVIIPNVVSNKSSTTITAIVMDEEGNIQTSGKVAFKVNGKTQGVVNINNGIAQLTVDSSKLSAKNYTITAVYGGNSITEKSTSDATLTITKTTPKITIETTNVKRTNNTIITVKLTDDQNNTIYGNTKVAVKLNGKTITHTTSQNGIIKINMDLTQYKNSQYDLTIVSGENNRYNTARMTTKLAIE